MERIILDASVVIKWFYQEQGSDKATSYLQHVQEGTMHILIPTIFFYEIGNILVTKKSPSYQAKPIISLLTRLPFEHHDIGFSACLPVMLLAQDMNISFYDASYVALMQKQQCSFLTADTKLYQKLHKTFPLIRLLS